jgi:c-di-GMP-binding flagellar brake protein YcgR
MSADMQPDNYLVKSQNEIARIIYNLCKKQIPVTVYSGVNEKAYDVSYITVIRPDHGIVGIAIHNRKRKNNPFIENNIVCVANHNLAHIQFELNKISQSDNLLTAAMPESMFRLKRRKEKRLSLPTNVQLTSRITHNNGEESILDLIDISTGGACMLDFTSKCNYEPGMILKNCQIDLGNSVIIDVELHIRSVSVITLSEGGQANMLNCAFYKNNTEVNSIIQNFIHGLELNFRKKLDVKEISKP